MVKPDFIIVGAPKCGTTALAEYLRAHPDVFIPWPKEPHYFAFDFEGYRYVKTIEAYLNLFEGSRFDDKLCGEASVFYLYSCEAIPEIRKLYPETKIVVMLRNPVDLALSMHAQVLQTRDENVVDFEKAWRLCSLRRAGKNVPRSCRDVKVLLYDELPLLGQQVERLLNNFPTEQVGFWFYEDFNNNTRKVYEEVLSFLNLKNNARSKFERINVRERARSQTLAQFTQKPPKWLVRAAIRFKKIVGIRELNILRRLRALNFFPVGPAAGISGDLVCEMRQHFDEDIQLLAHITGRNLDHWRGGE